MARRPLKPQLNQIRTWVRQGRTDAWIAHQLDVSARDITNFKREHELTAGETPADAETDLFGPTAEEEEIDLRAEDEALVAAALEQEEELGGPDEQDEEDGGEREGDDARGERGGGEGEGDDARGERGDGEEDGEGAPRRRRGRRGGRSGRGRGRKRGGRKKLEGTFDHGDDGYGLWLDPAVQDDPVYAEHWAGHRPVTVTIEAERIVIERQGGAGDGG